MKQIMVTPNLCVGCRSCELACAVEHTPSRELFAAVIKGEEAVARVFVETDGVLNLPLQCRHCTDPQCVTACIGGALTRDEESGRVVYERSKCVGCWMCVMVCPFGAIVEEKKEKVIAKCDRCPDREEPACTTACLTGALKFVAVDEFSDEKRANYLVKLKLEKTIESEGG